jgi:hypothetical protein
MEKKVLKVQTPRYNPTVLEGLSKKFGLTKMYLRQILRGDRQATISDTIKKEYREMLSKIEEAIK